jgi:hypothetical protein
MAQNAQMAGQVTDPSGAVIPGASITITNTETGVPIKTTSNAAGYYTVPQLQPGHYRLTVEMAGFKNLVRDGILLQVSDNVTLNVAMQVGSTTQVVNVTAQAPLLRTSDPQEGLVIDNKRIMELPQYSRDAMAFAQLAPNVNGGDAETKWGGDFRVNGGRTNQAEYYLDGQAVTTGYYHNIPASMPSKEALGEFKVVTNGLSAEYGRLSGGAVVLTTRGGTNQFHGEAYEFFKNNDLNANDWNSNRYNEPKAGFHDNVFGFTFGGPVRIPKLYNGTDKTFFFINYEGDRHVSGSNSYLMSVPTDLEKKGDFSQSLVRGAPAQIYDPLTGVNVGGTIERQQFAYNGVKNTIDPQRFDALAKIYTGLFPEANTAPLPNTNNQNNYLYSLTSPSSNNNWTGRLDENWNSSNSTHFTVSEYNYNGNTPSPFPMYASSLSTISSYTAAIKHNFIINPTTVFTLGLGFVRQITDSGSFTNEDDSSWGLSSQVLDIMGGTNNKRTPNIGNGIVTSLGGGSVDDVWDTAYQGNVALQKIHGRHTFKMGYEHRRYYSNEQTGGNFEDYSGQTSTAYNPTSISYSGDGFAGFMLGVAEGGDGYQYAGPTSLQTYHGAYGMDDFKVTKKLTLNLGVRWDFEPPRTDRFNKQVFWDRSYKWNIQPDPGWSWSEVQSELPAGLTLPQPVWMSAGIWGRPAELGTPEYPQHSFEPTEAGHFTPRLGMAYQVAHKTVIRASWGEVWMTKTGNWFLGSARWNVGYGDSARMIQGGTGDGGLTYPLSFTNPMPNGAGWVPRTNNIAQLTDEVIGTWWLSETKAFSPGHEYNGSLSVQRELGSGNNVWLVEAAWNNTMGHGLPAWLGVGDNILPNAYQKIGYLGSNLLTPVSNPFTAQLPPNTGRSGTMIPLGELYEQMPLWAQITTTGDPDGTSNYNSIYFTIEHRFSHGFGFLADYTRSRLLEDTGSIDYASPGSRYPQAGIPMRNDVYTVSTSDFRNKLVFNYSVQAPWGRGKRYLGSPNSFGEKVLDNVVGGWTAAGVTTIHSGTPIGPWGDNALWWQAGQATNSGWSERPIYTGNAVSDHVSGHQALQGAPGYTPYMNANAFRYVQFTPTQAEIGNVPWVIDGFNSPAFSQWDFSLMKNFYLGKESRYFQIRVESQNLFNHMNAGGPDYYLQDATFGLITSQNGSPRQMMIAGKLYF